MHNCNTSNSNLVPITPLTQQPGLSKSYSLATADSDTFSHISDDSH